MRIITAKTAGFCFGVKRAVSICEEAALKYPGCVTLGPIIHNERVVKDLEEKGVKAVSDIAQIPHGSTVIIRSHGAAKSDYEELEKRGVNIIDATCPDVKKIHEIVRVESQSGRLPVIIGERSHQEVKAIAGWCEKCEIFEHEKELSKWLNKEKNSDIPLSLVFQTTNTKAVNDSCIEILKKECTNYKIFDTICGATFKRQQEAAELSQTVDIMIVTGGKNSANSLRLADICRKYCSRVIFAGSADDIDYADIRVSDTIGITAGASTPAWIIKEVILKMSEEILLDKENTLQEPLEIDSAAQSYVGESDAPSSDAAAETAEPGPSVSDTFEQDASIEEAASDEGVSSANGYSLETDERARSGAEEQIPASDDAQSDIQGVGYAGQEDSADEPYDEYMDDDSASGTSSESFEEMLEKSIKTLHTGERVTGIVTSITSTEVSVDLGTKQSGYIPISEFTDESNSDIDDIIKVGDSIETFVMRVNDVEGMVMLSKKRLDAIRNWDDIEDARENKTVVEGVITEENKGGVVANVKGVRVFIPASQTGLPKSTPMTELLRKTVKLRITEVNQSRRRVVGSIRIVQSDERREKSEQLWNDIENGKQYDGVVKSMTSYGVFVDIGGVDGMIHISELSWTRIKQPSEVMSVGDEVSVYVLSFDKENKKISLGYKKLEDNPWTKFVTQNSVGDVVNVKIVKMMPFGAFAEIYPGVDGLIHISQITDHRIGLPSEILSDGQLVDVKITEIDNDRKKVSLSIRALIDPSSQPVSEKEASAAAADTDNTPVIVYDTDAPGESAIEEDEDTVEDAAGAIDASGAEDAAAETVTAEADAADTDDSADKADTAKADAAETAAAAAEDAEDAEDADPADASDDSED